MSTAVIAFAVLALFAALSFGGWRIHRREPHEVLRRSMRKIERELRAFAAAIGEALLPAFQSCGAALTDFAEAWRRATKEDG